MNTVQSHRHAIARGLFFTAFAASTCAFVIATRLAVSGALSSRASAIFVTGTFLAMVIGAFEAMRAALPESATPSRPLHRRHGFWVVAFGSVLSLPTIGSFGLTDPWETHYAEVAREMIERHDFISPWWANEGFFMTKPILIFWLEALSMLVFGAGTDPDRVLAGGAALFHPEWAVRMPAFFLSLIGTYFLYKGVSRLCGRRAGAFGAAILLTMPAWALMTHQAITDIPLVGCIAGAMGLLMIALSAREDEELVLLHVGRSFKFHAGHALIAFVAIAIGAQLAYLASRQISIDMHGVHFHADQFFAGSPANCTLPGQPACARQTFAQPRLTPLVQVCGWLALLMLVVVRMHGEKRVARVASLAAWTFAAVATMAKGPAGLAIPVGALVCYVVATRSWKSINRLEVITGALLFLGLVIPWYVAIYARHGRGFIDELVFRNMLGRTLDHLHDTNDGEDTGIRYYVWQLGYATFPWSGIAIAAVFSVFRASSRVTQRGRAKLILFAWALVAFALVSAMHTKFHHYMLPVVPALAMLAGAWLDEIVPRLPMESSTDLSGAGVRSRAPAAAMLVAASLVTALVGRDFFSHPGGGGGREVSGQARLIQLFTYRYDRAWPTSLDYSRVFVAFMILAALATFALAVTRWRKYATVACFVVGTSFAVFALDVYLPACTPHWGQRPLLDRYYLERGADGPPLVAYQMNWKGENYYTGNRVAIFITSGAPMRTYIDTRKSRGERDVYFVTEHDRVAGLRAELGEVRSFETLTDRVTDRQFCLVRARL